MPWLKVRLPWLMPRKLSAQSPSVLYVPAGYANGNMSLTADAKAIFFSTASLEESKGDDIRFDSRVWDPWTVEER